MICSLNCFLDFFEADSSSSRDSIVRRYKRAQSGEAKGRSTYYAPALRAIKGTLCPKGTADEKIAAIAKACIRPTWTDNANDGRIESNIRVFRVFRSAFGNKDIRVFPSPRMQFLVSKDVAVNVQPDLFFEMDKTAVMLKLGLCRDPRPEHVIRIVLQAFNSASKKKGLKLPITSIQFLDTTSGRSFVEHKENADLENDLAAVARDLNERWHGH